MVGAPTRWRDSTALRAGIGAPSSGICLSFSASLWLAVVLSSCFDSGMNLLCLCPTAECRTVVLQLGNGSIFCFVQSNDAGGGNGVRVGRGAFYVIRQLLYFSDQCVFLLAKVSYLLITMCKVVVFSRAGQSRSVVEDTNELISAECSCHTVFCSVIVKT